MGTSCWTTLTQAIQYESREAREVVQDRGEVGRASLLLLCRLCAISLMLLSKGVVMKKTPAFIACSIALTLFFYMLAYYLLPPPPPNVPMVVLFAAVAMVITWAVGAALKKMRSRGDGTAKAGANKPHVVVAFLLLGLWSMTTASNFRRGPGPVALAASSKVCKFTSGPKAGTSVPSSLPLGSSCDDGAGSTGIVVASETDQMVYEDRAPAASPSKAEPPPPEPDRSVSLDSAASDDAAMPRVTGIAILVSGQKEESGYGLYSYALISTPPHTGDLPKYKAYLKALLELPTAASYEQYVPRKRINITYLPLKRLLPGWETMSLDEQVDFALNNYDYARAGVMLASLDKRTGPGPVIISLLTALNPARHPHPVLTVDLTTAQPDVMVSFVSYFKNQAAKDRFWEESALSHFSVELRNGLAIAATGLGMSKDAVSMWVKFFH